MPVLTMIGNVLKAPFWAIQLLTSAKSFLDNPLIGSQRLNQRGLHVWRVRAAAAMCRWRRRRLARHVRADWVQAFERDGMVVIPQIVPPAEFPALQAAILAFHGPAREMQQGDAITRRLAVDPEMLEAIPALRNLLGRKDIVALLHYVASFRSTPLHYIQTIASHVGGKETDPQEILHADCFHSSLKSWLFLKPVSIDEGPFCYVRGSHRLTPERLAWEKDRSLANPREIDRMSARGSPRVTPDDLATMKLPAAECLPLDANTLVVADMIGFHARGASAGPGERVEIWSYVRRNPFLPWTGGDILSLQGIAERRVGWLWYIRDRLAPIIGPPWHNIGRASPLRTPLSENRPAEEE